MDAAAITQIMTQLAEQLTSLPADAAKRDAAALARNAALRAELDALRPLALKEPPSASSYAAAGSEALMTLDRIAGNRA
jgi:hypothetical protein